MISIEYDEYLKVVSKYKTFESFYKGEPEFFNNTYYNHSDIDTVTMRYLNYLSVAFNIKTPQGQKVPYIPYSWQIDYHKNSLLLNKNKTQNDFIMKGRGISYSYSTMIEAINVANVFPNTIIPVIAHRLQAARDIINVGRWICENANIKIEYNKEKNSELEIYTKFGKSVIRPYPSGTPTAVDSIRGLRPIFVVIDEGGMIKNLKDLLTSVENSIQTKQAKIVVGGTPKGKANHFWEMHANSNLQGYNKYFLPAFDSPKVEVNNIHSLKPIVWWYDIDKIRDILNNDEDSFYQEYMATPYNDDDALIPLIDIENAYKNIFDEQTDEGYIVVGADPATVNDYAVITAFKTNGKQFKQIYLKYYKGISLDDFENKCRDIIDDLNPEEFRLDCTGLGMQMGQTLKKEYECVKAINFASSIYINNETVNIKKFICSNLRYLVSGNKVQLIEDSLQTNHLTSVDKSLNFKSNKGHNDIFIADGLALLPLNFKYNPEHIEMESDDGIVKRIGSILNLFKKNNHYKDMGAINLIE